MKAQIRTISPNGYEVTFITPEMENRQQLIDAMPSFEAELTAAGYLSNTERHYPKTPDGMPICPKHGEVMRPREKQGDLWYSHKVVDRATGAEHYCRGHAGKSSPGWDV